MSLRRRRRRHLHRAVAVLVVALLASACGQDRVTTDLGQSPGAGDPAAVGPPLLHVARVGGFLPVHVAFSSLPDLTVYDDGRALVQGPQMAIFPGPALPNVQVHSLGDDRLTALVELAEQAGLLSAPPDYGQPPVADAPTTEVVLDVAGERYEHAVPALDVGAELPGEPALDDGLPPEAQAARERVSAFIDAAQRLVEESGQPSAYEPESFAVRATPGPPPHAPDGVEPQVLPWPLDDVDLAGADPCLVVGGAQAQALEATLQEANALTRFTQDGTEYSVAVRVLLPHERDC